MTKKHFEWAAGWLRVHLDSYDPLTVHAMTEFVVALFREFGEPFDEAGFRAAANQPCHPMAGPRRRKRAS